MSRVDAGGPWEVQIKHNADTIDIGAAKDFQQKYAVGRIIGKGGFGTVKIVIERATGKEFACKTINKRLEEQGVGGRKQERHIANVRREIAVLRRLRGTLNVAHFKQAFEDDTDLHIVMEYCQGGELWHRIGNKFYTERTVASFMRAVLRTLSQCHAHRILHRDIKPGNFMLLNDSDRAPLKAIDFGLAVFYEPSSLPRTDLGLEGTPWFMAPEVMSSEVYPSSDIWAAGVMTYQLLSGQLPFDDRRKPHSPALSVVWQAILTQQPSFTGKAWQDISEPAKNFVKRLLSKDPKARPSAKDALQDPWLKGNSTERNQGKPIDATVVQRIQRYAQTSVLKRSIFELIAAELIKTMTEQLSAASPEPSRHKGQDNMDAALLSSLGSMQHAPSVGSPVDPPSSSWSPFMGGAGRKRSIGQPAPDAGSGGITIPHKVGASAHGGLEYHRAFGSAGNSLGSSMSVHEAGYWRLIKTAVEAAKLRRASSMHGAHHYLRASKGWSAPDREQHRKAARIALDTSAHAGSHYQNFMRLSDDQ
ncbi:MAG: calcium-dependent kinase, partial [Trebouxia sp. A1-2]